MERRIRPRGIPKKKTFAFVNGSRHPVEVTDYSATGIGVNMSPNGLKKGSQVSVDLVVNEELCACCIPGTVCWTCGGAVGIQLAHKTEHQMACCHKIETRLMCTC